ncbi:hypothetical protein ACWEO1_21255 [Kitasatospora cineracea]
MRTPVIVLILLPTLVAVGLLAGILRYWRTRSFPEAVERGGTAAGGVALAFAAVLLAAYLAK